MGRAARGGWGRRVGQCPSARPIPTAPPHDAPVSGARSGAPACPSSHVRAWALPHQLLEALESSDEQSEPRAERHPRHGLLHPGEPQWGEGTGTPKPHPRLLETPDPLKELTTSHFSFCSPSVLLQPPRSPLSLSPVNGGGFLLPRTPFAHPLPSPTLNSRPCPALSAVPEPQDPHDPLQGHL